MPEKPCAAGTRQEAREDGFWKSLVMRYINVTNKGANGLRLAGAHPGSMGKGKQERSYFEIYSCNKQVLHSLAPQGGRKRTERAERSSQFIIYINVTNRRHRPRLHPDSTPPPEWEEAIHSNFEIYKCNKRTKKGGRPASPQRFRVPRSFSAARHSARVRAISARVQPRMKSTPISQR